MSVEEEEDEDGVEDEEDEETRRLGRLDRDKLQFTACTNRFLQTQDMELGIPMSP